MTRRKRVSDEAVVEYIARYLLEHSYAPTLRELCDALGWRSMGTASQRLEQLRGRGLVAWQSGESRTLHACGGAAYVKLLEEIVDSYIGEQA